MGELLVALLLSASDGGTSAVAPAPSEVAVTAPGAGDAGVQIAAALAAIPPELTADGLRDELKRSAHERRAATQKLEQERAQLSAERIQLQQLAAEVETARQGLREDTERLKQQGKKRPVASESAPAQPGAPVPTHGAGPLDLVAKTLRGMRPEQAAQMLLHVESSLAVELLSRMRPADAGAVLEKLKPEQAAPFLAALAAREVRHE